MKTSLLITAALAIVLAGCNKSTRSGSSAADTTANSDYTRSSTATTASSTPAATADTTADRVSNDMRSAANSASSAFGQAASSVATTARMTQWKLNATDIQADLDHNREIIRTKDAAGAATGSSDKSVIESLVKGRLEADSNLAALKLKVDAEKNGEVKLTGKAHSAEEVGRAIALALDTEGVTRVASKIKVDAEAKTNR